MTTNEELLQQATGESPEKTVSIENENTEESVQNDVLSKMNTDIPEIQSVLSDKPSEDIKLKKEDEGKEFIIETSKILEPQLIDTDGNAIPAKPFSDKSNSKTGYKTKLKLTYKDTNYASFIPNIKWFINVNKDGSKILKPWFATNPKESVEEDMKNTFIAEITKVYYKFCEFKNVEPGKLSQQDFVNELVGKKVILKTTTYKQDGTTSYRIDIDKFI